MKKVLSVILAIMMLFGAMSISVSAVEVNSGNYQQLWNTQLGDGSTMDSSKYVILRFDFNGGTNATGGPVIYAYDVDSKQFIIKDPGQVSGIFYMLPSTHYDRLIPGESIYLPTVTAPEGMSFQGWTLSNEFGGGSYGTAAPFTIPANTAGKVVTFTASYVAAAAEEDTLATVLNILKKVFGTIIGILFLDGSAQAGIELMEKVLGGLL
ncbi:MAG: hypothetical protein ACI4GC_08160 [Acutalibacteraceae bacterium]